VAGHASSGHDGQASGSRGDAGPDSHHQGHGSESAGNDQPAGNQSSSTRPAGGANDGAPSSANGGWRDSDGHGRRGHGGHSFRKG
jgi:hypothetical protein